MSLAFTAIGFTLIAVWGTRSYVKEAFVVVVVTFANVVIYLIEFNVNDNRFQLLLQSFGVANSVQISVKYLLE